MWIRHDKYLFKYKYNWVWNASLDERQENVENL